MHFKTDIYSKSQPFVTQAERDVAWRWNAGRVGRGSRWRVKKGRKWRWAGEEGGRRKLHQADRKEHSWTRFTHRETHLRSHCGESASWTRGTRNVLRSWQSQVAVDEVKGLTPGFYEIATRPVFKRKIKAESAKLSGNLTLTQHDLLFSMQS